MRPLRSLGPVLFALAAAAAAPLLAQEEPLVAGSDGVPVPKKTKLVRPTYPPEALAQGVRGIVILDLVVDAQGKVESTSVIRSVPGLDEAAIAAAQQWEYEPTKVNGKAVRVRVTVPITFALALPSVTRQDGIPELRQGVSPAWPVGAEGGGLATAEVTLEPDGRVGGARVVEGGAPWSGALLAALKTWRFSPPPEDAVLTFRVEAEFVSAGGSDPRQRKVHLKAAGLQQSGLLDEAAPAAATAAASAAPPSTAPAPAEPAPTPPVTTAVPATEPPASPATGKAPRPATPVAPVAPPTTPPAPTPSAPAVPEAPPAPPSPIVPAVSQPTEPPAATAPASSTAAPPVEVITAPPPPLPPENGVSAIRDVTLEPGVPDLTRGRRPMVPPLARMTGLSGSVDVSFSVSAAGTTSVQAATGPDLLKPAAEQAVASWVFRRARADRAYLVAAFTYAGDKGIAVVRPQVVPAAPAEPLPAPVLATPSAPDSPPPPQP